jgi:hypothetical protein
MVKGVKLTAEQKAARATVSDWHRDNPALAGFKGYHVRSLPNYETMAKQGMFIPKYPNLKFGPD